MVSWDHESSISPLRNSKENIPVEIIDQNCAKARVHPQFNLAYVNKQFCSILDVRTA